MQEVSGWCGSGGNEIGGDGYGWGYGLGWAGLGLGRRMVVMQERGGGIFFVLVSPGVGGCFVGEKRGGGGELWFRRGKMLS